jgi:hypothetical protein
MLQVFCQNTLMINIYCARSQFEVFWCGSFDKIETLRYENQFVLQEKANLAGQVKQMQAMLSPDKVQVAS